MKEVSGLVLCWGGNWKEVSLLWVPGLVLVLVLVFVFVLAPELLLLFEPEVALVAELVKQYYWSLLSGPLRGCACFRPILQRRRRRPRPTARAQARKQGSNTLSYLFICVHSSNLTRSDHVYSEAL